jgi:N-acylneuraminate cytidylyltransferase
MPAFSSPWTAVIPLRGGSKGLPGKNTRPLAGKPLYRHAVDLALAAGAQRVLISTDIAEVLTAELPAEVQALSRPPELCGDTVPMAPVLLHALAAGQVSGPVVLLQATSPLRQVGDVLAALQRLASGDFDLVMSVTEADRGVLKWGRLGDDGRYLPLSSPEHCFANRQSLPPVVKPNGAVYAMQAAWFVDNQGFVTNRLGTVLMPPERSHDIDNLADFERCEALLHSPH